MDSIVVFVHLGDHIDYLVPNLEFHTLVNNASKHFKLHVITDCKSLKSDITSHSDLGSIIVADPPTSPKIEDFDRINKLQDGFWKNCLKRFFVIEEYIRSNNLKHVFHLENDVMCFIPFDQLLRTIKSSYSPTAAISTFDHDLRCVPGFNFFPDHKSLSLITNFAMNNLAPDMNDMNLLAMARVNLGPLIFDAFPLCPSGSKLINLKKEQPKAPTLSWMSLSRFYDRFDMAFDAAAIGQFIDGTDPKVQPHHLPGFVNETCYFNYSTDAILRLQLGVPQISFQKHKFKRWIPIVNLHIHSKNIPKFLHYFKTSASFPIQPLFSQQ